MPRSFLLLIAALGPLAVTASADQDAARAKAIAPFLEKQTIAVGHADLTQIDLEPIVREITRLVPSLAGAAPPAQERFQALLAAIRDAGVDEAFITVTPVDLPMRSPAVLLPITSRTSADKLKAALEAMHIVSAPTVCEEVRGMLVVAHPETTARLKSLQAEARPELEPALAATAGSPVQLVLLPSADHRRVIEELMPDLPEEIGGGPSTLLTRGLMWASVGLEMPPQLGVRLVVQSADPSAATGFADKWNESLVRLAQHIAPDKSQPLESLAKLLATRAEGDRVVLNLAASDPRIAGVVQALAGPIQGAIDQSARIKSMNNSKIILLALHNWCDAHKAMPAQASYDASGQPLLSWRVHILPYLDQKELYEQFHLDEPWDSPHNRTLIDKMPAVYRSPAVAKMEDGHASYVFPVGEGTFCPGSRGVELKEITDGTSCTIAVIEVDAAHSPVWTQPADLPFDPQKPREGLGGVFPDGFVAAFADGHVEFCSSKLTDEALRLLFLRADGQPVQRP